VKLAQFNNKIVKIIAKNGNSFVGLVSEYFYPEDNESDKESIVIDTEEGTAVEFYERDIKTIEIIA